MPAINPSPSGFQTTVVKDTTTPPGIPSSILPLVVIGYASNDDDLPVNTPTPFSTPGAVQTVGGSGPGVEHAAGALDGNGGVRLVHLVNVATSTSGAYGAITTDFADADAPGVTADGVVLPEDDFDVVVRFPAGGEVGATGIKCQVSLDGGLHFFAPVALGTATSITLPNGGGKYNFGASSLADIITRVNEARTDSLAHFSNTAGGVHGAADTTSDNDVAAAATDEPTVIALMTSLLAATTTEAHAVLVAGGVHTAPDNLFLAALQAIPTPTTRSEVCTSFNAFKAAFNDHLGRTPIHGAADAGNLISGADLNPGVITAGDEFTLTTTAPMPDATQLGAAMQALRTYAGDAGTIALSAPITGSMVSTIEAELVELWKLGKFYNLVAPWRKPALTETAAEYSAALDADLSGIVLVDMRLKSGAVYHESALINTADGRATPRRPNAWWVSMAAARNEPETCLSLIAPQRGVRITDSRGNVLPGCLDESSGQLYSVQNRTGGTKRDLLRDPNGGVFLTQDLVLYDANSDWILGPHSAVINYALRVAAPVMVNASAVPAGFPSPAAGPLDDEIVKGLESSVQSFLDEAIVDRFRAAASTVQITDSSSAEIRWKVTNIPNKYIINGVHITASVVAREIGV